MRVDAIELQLLKLNPHNDRHGALRDESASIQWLLENRSAHMKALAKDLAETKRLYERPLVRQEGDFFVVFDGNRRTCCIKLLADPSLAPSEEWSKFFSDLKNHEVDSAYARIECEVGRIRSAVAREVSSEEAKAIFVGDWRATTTAEIVEAISDVSQKLVFLKRIVEGSNFLNSPDSPIDPIQVKQLIALLAATIEALQAPFVDTKHAGGFFKWLSTLSKSAAKKGVEKVVTNAMGEAANAGLQLVKRLLKMNGSGDLGNFT